MSPESSPRFRDDDMRKKKRNKARLGFIEKAGFSPA
jgi:hypothetical protein